MVLVVGSLQSSAGPHRSPGGPGGEGALMRARGGHGAGPREDLGLLVSLSLLHRRGDGAPRKAGMSRGDSQTVHAVGSRHDEVGGDESSTAEVTSTLL